MWFDAFEHCHNDVQGSLVRIEFPDGLSFIEQENLTIIMFDMMRGEIEGIKTDGK